MAGIDIIASGMGVASLGLQLMDGVRKLKQFWDEVKEAPEDIQYTIEELDALSLVLSDIHTSNANLPSIPSATVTKCLELCRRGTDILNTTVKDLNGAISKRRRIGSAKVVLKKDTLNKFRNRLRDAQYMLMLSRQTYSDALQMEHNKSQMEHNKLQTEHNKLQMETAHSNTNRQLQGLEELRVSITRSVDVMSSTLLQSRDTVVYDYETKRPMRGRTQTKLDKQAKYFQKKFSTPQLFSSTSYTWDFSGYQAPSGWTFNFRQYYTIAYHSPTWRYVNEGDVSGLQVLLQSKKATPFDRTLDGMTLLDLASAQGDYDMCCLLLNQGADPNDSSRISALISSLCSFSTRNRSSRINLLQLLYPVTEIHNPLEDISVVSDCDSLAWLLGNIDPTFKEWSFEERMFFALRVCYHSQKLIDSTAEIVLTMLHKDQLNDFCCRMVFRTRYAYFNVTFLRNELAWMGRAMSSWLSKNGQLSVYSDSTQLRVGKAEFGLRGRFSEAKFSKSIEFLERLIAGGSEIYRGDLLSSLLTGNHWHLPPDLLRSWIFPVSMRFWLEILYDSGIDLMKYGRLEHDKFLESSIEWELYLYHQEKSIGPSINGYWYTRAHLISFVYGPAVDDWKIWYSLDEPYRNYYKDFRDFWELVDHPERGMPGAWEEY